MKFTWGLALLCVIVGYGPRVSEATCVLASEFGFTLNCAFKKSGLFRVRNLGGVKAHVGLGFTVGDELGFGESISNLEGNKRRSASIRGPGPSGTPKENRITVQNASPKVVPASIPNDARSGQLSPVPSAPAIQKKSQKQLSPIHITSTMPPFKPIPPATDPKLIVGNILRPKPTAMPPRKSIDTIPDFHAMPGSVVQIYSQANALTHDLKPLSHTDDAQKTTHLSPNSLSQRVMSTHSNATNLAGLSAVEADILARKQALKQKQAMIMAAAAEAAATSTPAAVAAAASVQAPVRTEAVPPSSKYTSASKVMNAPKEYYPIGYDKNFDDNFASRVELPETSFYCGDQKHFPGLYADEDLGCMVFHVCALTDDGLIMKSFLCPESTLFDQTILKCNWWFYVDCKNSKNLYDSNIPISKSYQLMKALTFFSSIKRDSNDKKSENSPQR